MPSLTLHAPLNGWSAPLEEVPDDVFAQRMLGDGVAIDPTGNSLHAPCDGEVISIAAAKHAIALRADNGAEILMHVGVDTVALGGAGFELHVTAGARVHRGDRLLSFDLEVLVRSARSLITPILLTNGDRYSIVSVQQNREVRVGDELMIVEEVAQKSATNASTVASQISERVVVEHAHGIHARPAALIANYAKSIPAELSVQAHGRAANPRSAVALMSLGIRAGDELTIMGSGPDAATAIAGIRRIIASLEPAIATPKSPPRASVAPAPPIRRSEDNHLRGVIASNGFTVGRAFFLRAAEIAVTEGGQGVAHESAELERGRAEVRARLQELAGHSDRTAREVINAHLEFVDDWELVGAARRSIARGKSAAYAWRRAVRDSADSLKALGDPLIAERIDDLLDLEHQVLVALLGQSQVTHIEVPERSVVLAEDLKPSQLMTFAADKVAGICLAAGGPTSHVAILAAGMGIPALVALGPEILAVADDTWIVLDAEQGVATIAPQPGEITAAERVLATRRQRALAQRVAAQSDCHTADGQRIEMFANLGSLADAQTAVLQGAEGCGLLRTEFLFLERESAPDEDEQLARYQEIADVLSGRPFVVRTLDIGGDKPIAYLPLPAEDNPALGLRGVRTSLWRPDLLRIQLRALLRIEPAGQCRILLPMITDLEEIRAVRRILDEVRNELAVTSPTQVGAMIETPAAAVIADQIASEVDFVSIGTNDLTQYTLAMDRGHADLAARIDGLHPAVLRLIGMTADAASGHARPVAVCGGLASDPAAVAILIGLGVTELSVVPAMIPQLKYLIGTLTITQCRSLSQRALEQQSAAAVRALALRATPAEIKVAL
ncbi:MAG TPA: phosphoenolpyruvate--protein phosphotransferase [Steroidobacteraceae bacterium]